MKLYTEEQVFKVWKAGQKYWETSGASITFEELLEHETPIELPSDEKMREAAETYTAFPLAEMAFYEGAKWIKEQIENQK